MNLKALEGVAGLPRVLGFSYDPPAYIMTRHGSFTLHKLICDIDESGQAPSTNIKVLVIDILVHLSKILENVHSAGFSHNDLKGDQVAVDVSARTGVNVTLLDLGNMTRLGTCPYPGHRREGAKKLEEMR